MSRARISLWGIALVFVASTLGAGCYNFSMHRTAIPLKKGQVAFGGAMG